MKKNKTPSVCINKLFLITLFLLNISIGLTQNFTSEDIPITIIEILENPSDEYEKYANTLSHLDANLFAKYLVEKKLSPKETDTLIPILSSYLADNILKIDSKSILALFEKFPVFLTTKHRAIFHKIAVGNNFEKFFYEALVNKNPSLLWESKEQNSFFCGIIQKLLLTSSNEQFIELIEKYSPNPETEYVYPGLLSSAIQLRKPIPFIKKIIEKWPELLNYRSPGNDQSAIDIAILYNNEELISLITNNKSFNKNNLKHVLNLYLMYTVHFNDLYFNKLIKLFPESAKELYSRSNTNHTKKLPFERLIIERPSQLNISLETLYNAYPEAAKNESSQYLSALNPTSFIPFAEKHPDLIIYLVQISKIKLDENTLLESALENTQITNALYLLDKYPQLLNISSKKEKNLADLLASHFIPESETVSLKKILERTDFTKFFLKRNSYGAFPAIAAAQEPLYLSATLKAAKRENINFYSLLEAKDFVRLFSLAGLSFSLKTIEENKPLIDSIKKDLIPLFFNNGDTLHKIAIQFLREDESLWKYIHPNVTFDGNGKLSFKEETQHYFESFYENLLNLYHEPQAWKLLSTKPERLRWIAERKAKLAFAYHNAPLHSENFETSFSLDLSLKNFRDNVLQQICRISNKQIPKRDDFFPLEEWVKFFEELSINGTREEEVLSSSWRIENLFLVLEEYMLTLSLTTTQECRATFGSLNSAFGSDQLSFILNAYTKYVRKLFEKQDERIQFELMLSNEESSFSNFLDWQIRIAPSKKAFYLEKLRFKTKDNSDKNDEEAGLKYLQAFQIAIRKSFKNNRQ